MQQRVKQVVRDSDAHRDGHCGAHPGPNASAHPEADAGPDPGAHSSADAGANSGPDPGADLERYGDLHRYFDGDGNQHRDGDAYCDRNRHWDRDGHQYRDRHGNRDRDRHAGNGRSGVYAFAQLTARKQRRRPNQGMDLRHGVRT